MLNTSQKTYQVCVQFLITPVIRFCLRHGITFGQFTEIAKSAFVKEAQKALSLGGSDSSASKVSIMTGVHRAEVSRISVGEPKSDLHAGLLSRIIGQWQLSKQYSIKGKPKPLSFEGTSSEFANLVSSVSKEISHYSVLFELQRLNAVEHLDNKIYLRTAEHGTREDISKAMASVSEDIEALLMATEHNVSFTHLPSQLQLRTFFDNVQINKLEEIQSWILAEGQKLHSIARDKIGPLDLDVNPVKDTNGGGSVTIGTFAYIHHPQPIIVPSPRKRGRKRKKV